MSNKIRTIYLATLAISLVPLLAFGAQTDESGRLALASYGFNAAYWMAVAALLAVMLLGWLLMKR